MFEKIIPVIDLKRGQVVHGIAGDRARYQPVKSCLVDTPHPARVARAQVRLADRPSQGFRLLGLDHTSSSRLTKKVCIAFIFRRAIASLCRRGLSPPRAASTV